MDLAALPKAHLHLHLTGGMRPATLADLAAAQGRALPPGLLDPGSVDLDATGVRGWNRFQRLYDAARAVLVGPVEVQRVVREVVEDAHADGVRWLELQVDPSSYAARLGGLQACVEVVLDALRNDLGVGTGLVVACNRTRNPAEAETHARVARRFVGQGVTGFGLSNDETRGDTREFEKAFRLARDAGLLAVPHAGELRGAGSVRTAVERLGAARVGHGVRAVEDPDLLEEMALLGVACEVNPVSNVALHVHRSVADSPWRVLRAAGVPVAIGADDPLLFRAGLLDNYRALGDRRRAGRSRPLLAGRVRRARRAEGDLAARTRRLVRAWWCEQLLRPLGKANLEEESVSTGVLYVHSCPPALCPHVEWAVAGELGTRVSLTWTAQPAEDGTLRAEVSWHGRPGTAGRIAAALKSWKLVRYEVTEHASAGVDGERYSVTPDLGVFRAVIGANGDVMVGEDRLRSLLAGATGPQLAHGLDALLGSAWDEELEPYREAGDGAAVTWLHQVV